MSAIVIDLIDSDSDFENKISQTRNAHTIYDSDTEAASVTSHQSHHSHLSTNSQFSIQTISFSQSIPSDAVGVTKPRKRKAGVTEKVLQRDLKKIERESSRQLTGKYAKDEIGIILSNDLKDSIYSSALITSLDIDDPDLNNSLFYSDSMASNIIRWTYRPYTLGGKGNLNEANVITLPFVGVIFPTNEFLRLVQLSKEKYEFIGLGKALKDVIGVLQAFDQCPTDAKVVFILVNVEAEILKLTKPSKGGRKKKATTTKKSAAVTPISPEKTPPVEFNADIDDITAYLLHEYNIELVSLKCQKEVAQYLISSTKILSNYMYQKEESSYDNAFKVSKLRPDDDLPETEKEKHELQETWISMLQMLPRISREAARTLVAQSKLTCIRQLWEQYLDPNKSDKEKIELLQYFFHSNTTRAEGKLSKAVYNMFHITDKEYSLDE